MSDPALVFRRKTVNRLPRYPTAQADILPLTIEEHAAIHSLI
jgi:hypothetical protein